MKNILVIYFTQSGQLLDIAKNLVKPLQTNHSIDYLNIEMEKNFPFPWTNDTFYNTFPETFQQIPQPIKPPSDTILAKDYDLIILCYQVWFLTPSIPINSFLKSTYASIILKGKPVITVNGSRNMWAKAQDKVKALLVANDAHLVGNIALVDRHPNLVSVVTIVDWLFSGVKKKAFGIFPLPGVAETEIKSSHKFGNIILPYLEKGSYEGMQEELIAGGAVKFHFFLVSMDQKGNKIFNFWSKLVLNNPNKRKLYIKCFKVYLLVAIWVISPIVQLIETLLYPILYFIKIKKEKKHYLGI